MATYLTPDSPLSTFENDSEGGTLPTSRNRMWRIAADTGGTFTDCHGIAPDGHEHRVKVLSTGCLRATIREIIEPRTLVLQGRRDVSADFFSGFIVRPVSAAQQEVRVQRSQERDNDTMLELDVRDSAALNLFHAGAAVELTTGEAAPVLGARLLTSTAPGAEFPPVHFRLATTRATNALLERKGSRVAFFITAGFGDLLLIGDQRRRHLFALKHEPREVHYDTVCEVHERLGATGKAITTLDVEALRAAAMPCVQHGITTAAVSLLHSDVNPAHEQQVRDVLLQCGFTHVSLSSELAPFIRILPRAQSAVVNAYLTGPVSQFITDVSSPLPQDGSSTLLMMTSAAGLEPASSIKPKDLLLSGPAAGVLGALHAAQRLGFTRIITFDMGGTSTDVARLDGAAGYRFTQTVGGITLLSPSVAIETVAAGGGSICAWTPQGLTVGPQSAGSDPGPACYGKGGPLTVTDVNLLMGRFDPARAPIPLSRESAEVRLTELLHTVNAEAHRGLSREELLKQLLALATEHMADAIRKISVLEGYRPSDYALLAFGGAGPQHACDVAENLGITTILAPHHAGILSAVGLQEALPERFAEKQVLRLLEEISPEVPTLLQELRASAETQLASVPSQAHLPHTSSPHTTATFRQIAELRLKGQETPLQIEFEDPKTLHRTFAQRYTHLFGYTPPAGKPVELVSLRVIARAATNEDLPPLDRKTTSEVNGPQLVQDAFSTLVISHGWSGTDHPGAGWILRKATTSGAGAPSGDEKSIPPDLMRHRFTSIVEDMGALLRRTALSTNIRERLDFSCALLDAEGRLVVSAPHIPVHLGALGVCVREVMKVCELREGDTIITNHPAFGGSHLPDVTLITPVHDDEHRLLGIVANRAHHAEIGGKSPGSMPANATSLVEEGVVIPPMILRRDGVVNLDSMRALLTQAPYPTRGIEDNLADLQAQLAANLLGTDRLRELARVADTNEAMHWLLRESRLLMRRFLDSIPEGSAEESLDDGHLIRVALRKKSERLQLDFTGTSGQHPANLNATPAILRSTVLYVLRLALQEDLPLNEGLLEDVDTILPEGSFLSPIFTDDPAQCPAVVGGNTEVSQRVVDTLLKALKLQASSQGTMNNFLFGNARFGYYETLCGGTGAGPGFHGSDAMHSHMTNTAITDPEIIERRYPVRLRQFAIRRESGGKGEWNGGNGILREVEFLEPLTISLLTQHRKVAPYGVDGGGAGVCGKQTLVHAEGTEEELPSSVTRDVHAGDRLRIETPGGGAWGGVAH
ncbi:hydantoinase B/oxoprolinase family protein [Roseimicrobium sp. ORNL1]|uniref:hydantoinase B/oxoprolinase family protein n=1 Tax=Roseimicrobium sp. ORNL1 TaxID=2711231 RepID=UPI0013E0F5E4|nr:hydantoinase B/oxoprolinase family protein [Roseimicrobium sp. ORNL1]QIF01040.1 5-oxoprolinase [Roseimicrobium sp. ORNL1]